MAIINQFFKRKKNSANCNLAPEKISVETLKQLIPVRSLDDDKLQTFAMEIETEVFAEGSVLFTAGETTDSVFYLLKGIVNLTGNNGKHYDVEANSSQAKFPLCSGIKYTTTAVAKTDTSVLRVSQRIMEYDNSKDRQIKLELPEELAKSRLMQAFSQHYLDDEMEIPTLPDIAVKLRKSMQKDIGVSEAVAIIQLDPVISAKLVQVANCPLYISMNPAKSCFEAVNRIGLNASRNLVVSLSIKQIYHSSSPLIKKLLNKIWKHSVYISSISYVLASITKKVNPEEALLGGLIIQIGAVPFLNYAATLPDDYYTEKELISALPYICGPVGTNILRKWGFSDEFIDITQNVDNWFYESGDTLNLVDIVILSRLHSKIGSKTKTNLPVITSIPAASKLGNVSLSPQDSLQVLHDAKSKIDEALKTFSI